MIDRQTWSSRLTYILAVAGATVGFGATWRFPYLVGQNGGGAYVLTFCIAMIVIGIPMILVENAIGRRLHINSVDAFGSNANGKKINKAWKIVGWMGLCGAFGIMAYYMVIGGWVLNYIYNILFGNLNLSSVVTAQTTAAFYDENIINAPFAISIATIVFVIINFVILVRGAVAGIERAAKFLMPILFLLMIGMVFRNLTLDGALEGIKFYLTPDFSKINAKLFIDVLGQVFFALSLGFGVMITLSSFVRKDEDLIKTSIITGLLNTLIAVVAGFMIFPSLFTFGVAPDSGPSLVFKSLPIVFSHMYFGSFFAIAFFSLLMIAALTTSLPIYEVLITVLEEKFNIKRINAIVLVLGGIFLLGNLPSLMSTNILSNVTIFGKNIFDAYDAISATIFFVLTSLLCAIFVGWVLKDEAKKEILYGSQNSVKIVNIWFFYIKYIIPFLILVVFISSFYDNFMK
ncbi:sodium-dependent transporter [Campylobacter hyointestinalis subsp. lawsonii]|uniref:Transporter n=1 Tax=Campylobacter hyointestinalis subsp. lawsonii TaxID=91353 RepID=A0AAV6EEV3_CAMHY|nr:sodium-dependent transporter [Campylobacter hyointestinalis subsp. lawsonii]QKF69161.1 sodium-dependent transporter, SNF family [Campylobacter hyointestinalis subsp. lawsonii]RAZ25552.1 sodium-dependent transporter [Campylobacter hyointestinalis subsp. lawsonii]RAZ29647.1 sodium-dependent transporter [Campylobacter hyointestinalis subsp. lawsonii]RAZ39659.1 sodium-dependent transporter [Campylobacter hyointestinalis subsp. lawsonii]